MVVRRERSKRPLLEKITAFCYAIHRTLVNLAQLDMRYINYLLLHLLLVFGGVLLIVMASDGRWLSGLGLSLVASGISGSVVFVYVIMTQRVSEQLEALREFGLVYAFPVRATRIKDEYDKRLAKARSQIDVLAFGLSSLREDLGHEFPKWKSQARVRILLIDPDYPNDTSGREISNISDLRDRDEGRCAGTIRSHVVNFVRETSHLVDNNFRVRLYRCLPTVNIFRVDGEMFWGPYLVKEQGRNTPTFVIRHGVMFDKLLRHFDEIWEDNDLSRDPPASWLQDT